MEKLRKATQKYDKDRWSLANKPGTLGYRAELLVIIL
jgi:hypothetical protein